MHHKFDTNKNESFNKLVTKFVPKTSYLCGSIAGKTRVYVAAGIDSIGYVSFYSALYNLLGIEYNVSLFCQHTALDNNRIYRNEYFKNPGNRKKKAAKLAERIKKLIDDTKADKKKGRHTGRTWQVHVYHATKKTKWLSKQQRKKNAR